MPATNAPPLAQETIVVPATVAELEALHAALDRFWAAVDRAVPGRAGGAWRLCFSTAVIEVGSNVIRHATPAGAMPGRLQLGLRTYPDRVEAHFRDHGIPFAEPGPSADDGGLPEGGLGLAIARSAVDRLTYRRTPAGANHWRLVKYMPD